MIPCAPSREAAGGARQHQGHEDRLFRRSRLRRISISDVRQNTLLALEVTSATSAPNSKRSISAGPRDVDADCLHWYNMMHFGRQTIVAQKDNATS
jgi:hypothetical protein